MSPRSIDRARLALHAAVALFAAWVVFARVDLLSVDLAGHLASAQAFARGYYHHFHDGHFLGTIHGLFYPPLEDALLAAWLAVFRVAHVGTLDAYRAYLAAVTLGYVASLAALGGALPDWRARLAFAAFALGTFFALDQDLYLQGLKLVDLAKIGLTAQLLGGAFVFVLVRELLGRARRDVIALTLAGAVLAHLVMGLVAALVIAVNALVTRDRARVAAVLLAAGVAAVFWVPFFAHGAFLVKNTVLSAHVPLVHLAAAIALAAAVRTPRARTLAWPAAILLAPTTIAPIVMRAGYRLPEFHWYRLDFIGIVLLVLGATWAAFDPAERGTRARCWTIRGALGVAYVATLVTMIPRGLYLPSARPLAIDGPFPIAEPPDAPYGRHWILQDGRPFDFSAESLATALDGEQRTPKGLFWESAKSNHLVGSYMASLNHPPVVLDYFYFHDYTCPFQACLVDHFVADFNVTRWSADERTLIPVFPDAAHRACDGAMWAAHETPSFRLFEEPGFGLDEHRFRTSTIAPTGALTNAAVEVLEPSGVAPFVMAGAYYFHRYFLDVAEQCDRGAEARHVLVVQPDWEAFQALARDVASPAPHVEATLRKVAMGRFAIDVPSDRDVVFHIKLNYLPGARLVREDGSEVRILRAYPGMLAVGHGKMTLAYEPTLAMRAGTAISWVTAVAWIALVVVERRRAKRAAA